MHYIQETHSVSGEECAEASPQIDHFLVWVRLIWTIWWPLVEFPLCSESLPKRHFEESCGKNDTKNLSVARAQKTLCCTLSGSLHIFWKIHENGGWSWDETTLAEVYSMDKVLAGTCGGGVVTRFPGASLHLNDLTNCADHTKFWAAYAINADGRVSCKRQCRLACRQKQELCGYGSCLCWTC